MKHLEKYSGLKYNILLSLVMALVTAGVVIVLVFPQWRTQFNENDFGLPFDITVFILASTTITGILFVLFLTANGVGWLWGALIEAALFAMLATKKTYNAAKGFSKLVITQAAIDRATSIFYPIYLAHQKLLDFLAAKLSSRYKFPHQLFPVSCILLS